MDWVKRLFKSGDVVFPVVILVFVIMSLYDGKSPLNDWPMMLIIGCLWLVSARHSEQQHATSHAGISTKTTRMRALDLAWLAFGTAMVLAFGLSSVESGGWFSRMLTAALALVVVFGMLRYVREMVQTGWRHPDDTRRI